MHNVNGHILSIPGSDSHILPRQITLSALCACLSLILLAAAVAAAENAPEPTNLETLADDLDLSADEAIAVDRLLIQAFVDRQTLKNSTDKGNQEEHWAALKSITENADRQLKTALTQEQFSKYIALREQLRRETLRRRVRDARWNNH